ncbi:MAG: signal peptide peptidase SppA [Alphaproteobacteria bacterium]|nr:signal peptide peptidase SppA [Alphaproteobacteria bacterium]
MFRFIANCFAVIGFLVVALMAWGVASSLYQQERGEPEPQSVVLTIDFTQPVVERNEPSPFSLAMDDEPIVLLDLLSAIEKASRDPHVKGIAARFGTQQPSMVHAQEIRAAIARFRESGKFTYAFGTDFGQFGLGSRAYFLASAFENVWLQPVGTVSLTGVAVQSPFVRGALEKMGVVADFMQREEYKSFMEVAQRDGFSPPVKAEMQGMIDNLSDQVASGIAQSRKWDVEHVKGLMTRGPFTDEEAVQEGLVTKLAYADEFESELDRKAGVDASHVDVGTYLGYSFDFEAEKKRTTVALIYGSGIIMDKSFDSGSFGEPVVGADTVSDAFAAAEEDDEVKAIVFRVDSPGGSPAAAETIRRAVIHAQKQGKPVIVSMGEAAASGGYWVAMNGDKIVANSATLTGSIGVVAGKFASNGLLQKLGVSEDGVSTSPNAGMWSLMAPFSDVQRGRINALLDNIYRTFVADVSAARNIPMEKMPDVAKGRVFTGEQAVKAGLVDELGGYAATFAQVRALLKLDEKAPLLLQEFPVPPSPVERLVRFMRRIGAESAAALSLASGFDQARAALRPLFEAVSMSGHPVSARMQMERVYD